jgi:large conductance mechanosensitive channel
MSLIKEFKDFVGSGNAVDLAVGVLAAGAIGAILKSFIDEMVLPLTGLFGKADWANLYYVLKGTVPDGTPLGEARKVAGAVVLGYGQFMTVAVNTLILVFAVFMVVKAINNMKKQKAGEEAEAMTMQPAQEVLLTEIRDLLKSR